MPTPPVAPAPRRLLFRDHGGARGRALRPQVVQGVERRAQPAEHAALRNAPARGEIDGRDAVEHYRRHKA